MRCSPHVRRGAQHLVDKMLHASGAHSCTVYMWRAACVKSVTMGIAAAAPAGHTATDVQLQAASVVWSRQHTPPLAALAAVSEAGLPHS